MSETKNRTLALAAIVQIAHLVKNLASKGSIDYILLNSCIESILANDNLSINNIYDNIENYKLGLEKLIDLLTPSKSPKDSEIARYTISLMHLERLLLKHKNLQPIIEKGLSRAKKQAEYFSPTHENVIANLSSIYIDSLSTLSFRVHISGKTVFLSSTGIINKIRALLLSGISYSKLWRQYDGSRWQLVFGKRLIIDDAKQLLEEIATKEQKIISMETTT